MTDDTLSAIDKLRRAAVQESAQPGRPVSAHFHDAEVWVELTERGGVKLDDGWVYVYTDPAMLPGGQLEGFGGGEGLDVEATQMTGEHLRRLVGPQVGIMLDYDYRSQCRIQVPLVAPVSRDQDD